LFVKNEGLQKVILLLAAAAGSVVAERTVMEQGVTSFGRATWIQKERVTAGDTIDVTFVLKTCPKLRAKFEEKV